ncbi:hypothetical protein GJ496_003388 [Pomphorhynchus laevis]|nr:hypothetical protein GJ496_003388 [Pomphorhynchus laevis]
MNIQAEAYDILCSDTNSQFWKASDHLSADVEKYMSNSGLAVISAGLPYGLLNVPTQELGFTPMILYLSRDAPHYGTTVHYYQSKIIKLIFY